MGGLLKIDWPHICHIDMVADMKVDKVANMVVDMDFSMIFLYFMVKYFGVTRLERPKAVKDDVKQARRA